ncbi:beta-lactamase/transpeptidase-like protein [Xylaria arbuscula]|nr:beta-lactamase/transpeptidase-like protein [Xylaria arbuscula]
MQKQLNEILQSHVVTSSATEVRDQILAGGFVVVNTDGVVYMGSAGGLDFDPLPPAKLATAVALLLPVKRGIISLDDDVIETIPEFAALPVLCGFGDDGEPILEAHDRAITLRHLLSHNLGIGAHMAHPDLTQWSKYMGRRVNFMSHTLEEITTPLKFAPREGWYYGTALMGSSLSSFMQDNIFGRLSMEYTTFCPSQEDEERMLAFIYAWAPPLSIPEDFAFETSGSGLFSSPTVFARLLRGILLYKILRPETTDLLFTPQLNNSQRGILMAIATYARDRRFAHELSPGAPLAHGPARILNMADVRGKRRRGSMM